MSGRPIQDHRAVLHEVIDRLLNPVGGGIYINTEPDGDEAEKVLAGLDAALADAYLGRQVRELVEVQQQVISTLAASTPTAVYDGRDYEPRLDFSIDGLPRIPEGQPGGGNINNCRLACIGTVEGCQMCSGICPDYERLVNRAFNNRRY